MRMLLAPFLLASGAVAFVPPSRRGTRGATFVRSGTSLHALIYGAERSSSDEEYRPRSSSTSGGGANSWLYEDEILLPQAPEIQGHQHAELLHHLSTTPDYMGALARLAVAFSPPDQGLALRHIESVLVVGLDGLHIEIQAVVCGEEEGCVTIFVPIAYPQACNEEDEGCFMHQLETLDHQAEEILQQMEGREEWEQEREQQWHELVSLDNLEYPSWWKPPLKLLDECKSVRILLNDPHFQPEIQGLAYLGLGQRQEIGWVIEEAAVVDISPAGFYIRARATQLTVKTQILDLPVQFDTVATTVEELRSSVLGAVAPSTDTVDGTVIDVAGESVAEGLELGEATAETAAKEDIMFLGEGVTLDNVEKVEEELDLLGAAATIKVAEDEAIEIKQEVEPDEELDLVAAATIEVAEEEAIEIRQEVAPEEELDLVAAATIEVAEEESVEIEQEIQPEEELDPVAEGSSIEVAEDEAIDIEQEIGKEEELDLVAEGTSIEVAEDEAIEIGQDIEDELMTEINEVLADESSREEVENDTKIKTEEENSSNISDVHSSWLYDAEQSCRDLKEEYKVNERLIGALARLAVAFSPPNLGLHLQDIESVSVLCMDSTHIDIQAVICGEEGCTVLKVPITFPHACTYDDAEEECILHQLETLDHQAGDLLQQMEGREEWEAESERQWQELVSCRGLEYPRWWQPLRPELMEESQSVRNLLNDPDFQPEIQGLAYSLLGRRQETGWTIEEAVVVDISQAGLYVRARARMYSGSAVDSTQLSARSQILNLPLQFGAVATNVEELRAAILGSVASTTEETVWATVEIAEGVPLENTVEEAVKEDILFVGNTDEGKNISSNVATPEIFEDIDKIDTKDILSDGILDAEILDEEIVDVVEKEERKQEENIEEKSIEIKDGKEDANKEDEAEHVSFQRWKKWSRKWKWTAPVF